MSEKETQRQEEQFSIEKELADMKKALVEESDESIIDVVINEKEQAPEAEANVEETPATKPEEPVKEEKPEEPAKEENTTPVKETKAPAKKAPAKKAPAKKPLTKAQIAAKEKEKAAKAKEAEKRKQAVQKAKEKEKTRLAVAQAKEKEKARMEAMIQKEKERAEARAKAKKAAEEKLASLESKKQTEDAITSDIDEIKMNKDFISEAKGLDKIGPKKSEFKPVEAKEETKKPENVSESLQRLRSQIAAKKDLEQRIMDGKATKPVQPENETVNIKDNLKDLEAKNKDLKNKIEKAQANVGAEVKEKAPEANVDLEALRKEIADLEAKVKELEASLASEKEQNSNLSAKHEAALKEKDEEFDNLQKRYDNDVKRLNKEVEELKNTPEIDTSKIESNLAKEFNAKVRSIKKESDKELEAKQKENDALSKELTNTKRELTKTTNALNAIQDEFDSKTNELNQKVALANEEIDLLKRDLEEQKNRNVASADVASDLEEERNKLVEQNRELEKGKKELALQESYLNLYKQEIDAKADEQVKQANAELARYKKENKVQEDLIRAEEQVKYQELNSECNDAKKRLAELTKEANKLEVKVIDYERKLSTTEASLNSQNELNKSLKAEVKRLNAKIKEQPEAVSNSVDNHDSEVIKEKDAEIKRLQDELEAANNSFAVEREAYAKQSEAIDAQLTEIIKGVEENEDSIANTSEVIEHYREALENEKNAHLEAEQQLYDALNAKEEEIKRLKGNASYSRYDEQYDQFPPYPQPRRDMFGPRPPYQNQYYAPYDPYRDPYEGRMREDHEREIAKRDEIIASLQKERKAETDALNAKIEALESQVRDLNEALAKKQAENAPQASVDYRELDEYCSKIRTHLVVDSLMGFANLNDLLEAYQEAKKKISGLYANECEKLDIANKYITGENDKATQAAKREFLDDHYAKMIKELDANLENGVNAVKKEDNIITPVVTPVEVAPVVVDVDAPASDKQFEVPEEIEKLTNEDEGDQVDVNAPIYDSYEEKVEEMEKLEPITVNQTPLINPEENENQVVITFDSEYLNKLNNIRRTRKSLEDRKVVENANHRIELSNNEKLQKEYARKIAELQKRIDELTVNYQASDDHSEAAHEKFEVDKQKVFFELSSRQSQLNKLSDDDVRKINLRYRNIISGIDDQLARLDAEEKELRDTYILKQRKEESKQNRDAALQKQFEEANVRQEYDEEPRYLESQDEIRERKFRSRYEGLVSSHPKKLIDDKDVANIVLDENNNVVSGYVPKEEVKPVDIEEVKSVLKEEKIEASAPEEEKVVIEEVRNQRFSPKEIELRKKYESYCNAEKVYSNDIASVREYKRLNGEYLSYEKAISENNDKIIGLTETMKASHDAVEIGNLKQQINELKAKGDNLRDNRDYAKKQLNASSKDKHVKDYMALVQKIDDAAAILKKYQAKREKKDR